MNPKSLLAKLMNKLNYREWGPLMDLELAMEVGQMKQTFGAGDILPLQVTLRYLISQKKKS